MTDELTRIDQALEAGDVGTAVRQLRLVAETAPLPEVARRLGRAGERIGFDDIVAAAGAVAANANDARALFDLGYACVGRGIPAIGIPMLAAALRQAPGQRTIVTELAVAYEQTYRYADAVAVLEANNSALRDWPDRYLLAFNSVMSGDLDRAERHTAALSAPDADWIAARDRLTGMLARSRYTTDRTVRGWHYILNASILGSLSPYGFDEGMNGRYAFIQDSPANCARTLRRLRLALPTRPASVSLLPDRSSRILGHAAATALDVPAVEWQPGQGDTVIVAYNLADIDPNVLAGLRQRTAGSVLIEHATRWTDPPRVAAEFVGLLHQSVVTPWGSRLMAPPGRETYQTDPDDRPEETVAAEIASAADAPDEVAPGDDDAGYAEFLERIHNGWPPAAGQRDRLWSPGPIRSSYFA